MRKIIIAICGIILTGGAMGVTKRTLKEPNKVSNQKIIDVWKAAHTQGKTDYNLSDYTKDVKGMFALNGQFNTKAGTYGTNNEGSIVPIIAHKIYEHGGEFCMTQIQAGFGSDTGSFIDYFKDNTGQDRYKCQIICESGYSGDNCSVKQYDCSKQNINYKNDLNNINDGGLRLLSGEEKGRITDSVEVFDYYNGLKKETYSYAIVLGVLGVKEHSVMVSPVWIKKYYAKNKITDALALSDDKIKLLCAPGYTENETKDDCVLSPQCSAETNVCQGENPNLGLHQTWEIKTEANGTTCKYIACKSGYGFKERTKECEKCETTHIQGINANGVCRKCDDNQIFKDGDCRSYKSLSAQHLLNGLCNVGKCWMESNPTDYHDCVFKNLNSQNDICE